MLRRLQSTAAALMVPPLGCPQKRWALAISADIEAKTNRENRMKTFRFLVAGLVAMALSGCGDPDSVKEIKTGTDGGRGKYDIYSGVGGGKQEQGSLFGPGGLFGSKAGKKENEGTGVAVNAFLWRASLDTINFIPLVSADPFGGVIITDWYTPAEQPNERMKVQITILDRELRADGVRVAVFKQQTGPKGGGWVDAQVDPRTNIDIENAILTRARQLRIAQGG
jgi:hypothetical protein